jgi:hypothetical protein
LADADGAPAALDAVPNVAARLAQISGTISERSA